MLLGITPHMYGRIVHNFYIDGDIQTKGLIKYLLKDS